MTSLRLWGWCLVWLISIWFVFALMVHQYRDLRQQPLEISCFKQPFTSYKQTEGSKVVALGNSLLYRSIGFQQSLALGDSLNSGIAVFARGGATPNNFQKVLSALNDVRPDLIIIQDALLLQGKDAYDDFDAFKSDLKNAVVLHYLDTFYSDRYEKKLDRVTRCFSLSPIPERVNDMEMSDSQIAEHIDLLRGRYSKNYLSDGNIKFLSEAKSIGAKVIVLSLPRSSKFITKEELIWKEMLSSAIEPLGISVVDLGAPLPDDHYYDGRHPNALGRSVRHKQFRLLVNGEL